MSNPTQEQVKAAFQVTALVCEAIREAGRIPSGELYATLMGKMDLETYDKMIATIKRTGLVEERGHELIWMGPLKEVK
jgi:hypothetical protein